MRTSRQQRIQMLSVSLVRCNENIVIVRHSRADKSPAANSDVISLSSAV